MFLGFRPKNVFSATLLDRVGFHNLWVENNILKKEYVSTTWEVSEDIEFEDNACHSL